MIIDERTDGHTTRIESDPLRLVVGKGSFELPREVLEKVMERYAKPLADGIELPPGLPLGDGCTLHLLRHRARYDVIARDFLVLSRPNREPIAELATTIAAALAFLFRAVDRRP
jgi:hypothetical protein